MIWNQRAEWLLLRPHSEKFCYISWDACTHSHFGCRHGSEQMARCPGALLLGLFSSDAGGVLLRSCNNVFLGWHFGLSPSIHGGHHFYGCHWQEVRNRYNAGVYMYRQCGRSWCEWFKILQLRNVACWRVGKENPAVMICSLTAGIVSGAYC
jgi:hypothetical protein